MISVQSMPVAQALGDALKRKETPTAIFAMGVVCPMRFERTTFRVGV